MPKSGRKRARARRRHRPASSAEQAAIRHVRWLVGRALSLGSAGKAGKTERTALATEERAHAGPPGARRAAIESSLRRGSVLSRRVLGRLMRALTGFSRVAAATCGRGLVGFGHLLVARRVFVIGLFQRLLWWAALALFVVGGRDLLSPYEGTLVEALPYFIVGFALCALAILMASSRRIRWAALALGFGHGALCLLLWTVLQA